MTSDSVNQWTKAWCDKNGISSELHDSVTSTNDIAHKSFIESAQQLKVYLTDNQTAGRGRGERKWTSADPGQTLLSSWCFSYENNIQPIFSPLVGLSVYKALENTWPKINISMKAPNDIYLEDGKLAGILIESTFYRGKFYAIIGLGMNVLSRPQIEDQKTSDLVSHCEVNEKAWHFFCSQLLQNFSRSFEEGNSKLLSRVRREELVRAINANPTLPDKLEEISSDGDLVYASHRVPWLDL